MDARGLVPGKCQPPNVWKPKRPPPVISIVYFANYTMSFNAFRKVGVVFIIAIAILACSVAWQMSLTVETFIIRTLFFVGLIVFAGRFLQTAIAPTPVELISIDFLQNNFANLHLSSLFNCSSVHIDPGESYTKQSCISTSAITLCFPGIGSPLQFRTQRTLRCILSPMARLTGV
jgi:hypothetical protein